MNSKSDLEKVKAYFLMGLTAREISDKMGFYTTPTLIQGVVNYYSHEWKNKRISFEF